MGRKQNENALQRQIVEFINERSNLGCKISRIKNMGTFDPKGGFFRSNGMEKGIPDIIGCNKDGRGIFIEVKMFRKGHKAGQELPIAPNDTQCEYLTEMDKRGAIVGVAYNPGDAFDIIADNPHKYPRNKRTYIFRPVEERPEKKKGRRIPTLYLPSFHDEGDTTDGTTGEGTAETTECEP